MGVRANIRTQIYNALSAITTGNGYSTDVSTVSKVFRSYDEARGEGMPWLGMNIGDSNIVEDRPFQKQIREMTVQVIGYVEGATVAARESAIDALEDDVKVALMADRTLGGNARNVSIRFVTSHDGQPDLEDFGFLLIEVGVRHCRDLAASD